MLYECTIWSYLQVRYILLTEAYIGNTWNDTTETSSDSGKCNSFIQVHIHGNEWPAPPTHTCMHTACRTTPTLHKIQGSTINRIILVFYWEVTQIKNSDLELSDIACTLHIKQLQKEWTPNIILTGWSSVSVLLPHMNYTESKQREWPKAFIILCIGHLSQWLGLRSL